MMKKIKLIVVSALTIVLTSTTVFASNIKGGYGDLSLLRSKSSIAQKKENPDKFNSMSIQEKRSIVIKKYTEHLNNAVKNGEISKQDANKEMEKMKAEVQKWDGSTPIKYWNGMHKHKMNLPENFDKMSLQEKRDWMIKNFTEKMNRDVKSGEITEDDANRKIENMKQKISNWDGTFHKRDKKQ